MKILTLDLSKSCTGWAIWHPGWEMARVGHWRLGSEYCSHGDVFNKLHKNLEDLRQTIGFDHLFWEKTIDAQKLRLVTNANTIELLGGLNAYAEGYRAAYRMAGRSVNISSWRQEFIGTDLDGTIKASVRRFNRMAKEHGGKKKSASADLKAATEERCRQLGFNPRTTDEADAIGILDYQLSLAKITPPWREKEVLLPAMKVPG